MTRRGEARHDPRILLYHRISDYNVDPLQLCVTPSNFEDHLSVLSDNCTVVAVDEMVSRLRAGRDCRGLTAITFDDGYPDMLENTRPLLQSAELPATLFLTGPLGDAELVPWYEVVITSYWSDSAMPQKLSQSQSTAFQSALNDGELRAGGRRATDRLGVLFGDRLAGWVEASSKGNRRYLSQQEITNLAASLPECVSIACHGQSHARLTSMSSAAWRSEIAANLAFLSDVAPRSAAMLYAFAFGTPDSFSLDIIEYLRQTGFAAAFTTEQRVVTVASDLMLLPRLLVRDWSGDEFREWLATDCSTHWLNVMDARTLAALYA